MEKTLLPTPGELRRMLTTCGYVFLPSLFEVDKYEDSVYFTRARYAKAIFNNKGQNDRLRLQVKIEPPSEHVELYRHVMETISPKLFMGQSSVIKSKPGCSQQFWHTDYPPKIVAVLPPEDRPYSLMVALSPYGADLPIIDAEGEQRVLHIDRGDGLLFAGDLVHAGASYKETNLRFHVYFDTPSFERPRDIVWPARMV
jgi:hypothetical protein